MTSPYEPGTTRSDFINLVRAAFSAAAAAGKSSTTMTTAVLKNRLLLLTDRSFKERDFGQPTLVRLLLSISDVVEVDQTQMPYLVRLRSVDAPAVEVGSTQTDFRRKRVREDLWAAALDVTGDRYVWDSHTMRAELRHSNDERLGLPALSKAQLDEARMTFANDHWTPEKGAEWIKEGGSARALPPELRGRWAELFKHLVLNLLHDFFAVNAITEPPDLLTAIPPRSVPSPPLTAVAGSIDLRRWVLAVVSAMTDAELATLAIPAAAASRVFRP